MVEPGYFFGPGGGSIMVSNQYIFSFSQNATYIFISTYICVLQVIFIKQVYRQFRVGLDFDITMSIKPRNITGLLLGIQGRRDYLILQVIYFITDIYSISTNIAICILRLFAEK